MVYIREGNTIFYNNIADVISQHEYLYTTKKSSYGRYYFEFSHIEGPYCHLAGFDFSGRKVFAYPQCQKDSVKLYFEGTTINENIKNFGEVEIDNFSASETVGLAADTYTMSFYIIYKNNIKRFSIPVRSPLKVSPVAREGYSNIVHTDKVSFNFGEKEFVYNVPFGFIPWSSYMKKETCINKRSTLLLSILCFCFVIS